MLLNGKYIGLGVGDRSDEIRAIRAFMRRVYKSYAGGLEDTDLYDAALATVVSDMQSRLVRSGKLVDGQYIPGVINYATKIAMGYLKPAPAVKPVFFTVEGHLSAWNVGPCAATAQALEAEGICRWQGVGYDNVSLPFNDASGIAELDRLFSDYTAFPIGTPWFISIFSQGALVGCQFLIDQVFNPQGRHSNRANDWLGTLAHGNPMRQEDVVAPWISDPPKRGTGGLYKRRMSGTAPGEILADRWREVCRTGDLYIENDPDTESGKNKQAVCVAVADGEFMGAGSLAERIWVLVTRFGDELWSLFQSIVDGVRFLTDMSPHGGYDLAPGIDWARSRIKAGVAK